jgi:bifunctional UDP-N-acetylglucosamine pyrophosphorylase / glucosamine-1-phosphate N-acetyltransferase
VASDTAAVVLAAGQGTRFRSDLAKVLHRAAGLSLLGHVLEALRPVGFGQIIVVVGHQADDVTAEVRARGIPGITTVLQADQRGTGHAVQQAMPAVADGIRRVLVLPGDTPLLTAATLTRLLSSGQGRTAAMLTALLDDPSGYGRVVRGPAGEVEAVVEHRDATGSQLDINEINAGMYVVERGALADALGQLGDDNAQGEVYLTDVVGLLAADGQHVAAVVADELEIAGVNDREQLALAAAELRRRHLRHLMVEVGVSIVDPTSTHVDVDVEVGRDATILPHTVLESGTVIGARAIVGPFSHLVGCTVGEAATVHSTRASQASIGDGASVGPYSHLRPGTVLGVGAKTGAYVETKNATIGDGSKVPHLAYVGDATVGEKVNIGCGVITVNYDGKTKSHTIIEDGAFLGCDTMLVAPVTIGAGAYTAAGSTITNDVPAGALGIARARQTNKDGWAERRRDET